MWRWLCATMAVLILLPCADVAQAAGSLRGTWKGTLYFVGSTDDPINVQLQFTQRGRALSGVGTGCELSGTPGCPPGTGNGSVTFHGNFQGSAFTLEFDAPGGKCVAFVVGEGSLKSDGEALNILARGQDGDCNPVLWLINAARP